MTTFHFKPELVHMLKWFRDSPDTGNPACICSYCGEIITDEDEIPLRCFRQGNMPGGEELRLHMYCARQVVVELLPKVFEKTPPAKPTPRYKYDPEFAEGRYAFAEGHRRGSNPYSASGKQRACLAWWEGWDDAWEEANAKPQD